MESRKLSILKIEIETFKKIRNLTIEPEEGANLFFGSFRSGKTSLCEFIHFVLYGAASVSLARDNAEDAKGSILFSCDGKKFLVRRSVTDGNETCEFTNEDLSPVSFETTPGEHLTGLNAASFDLIAYFKQARYEMPFSKPTFRFLEHLASMDDETACVYSDYEETKEKCEQYRNDEKNGSLDRLEQEKEFLLSEIKMRSHWTDEEQKCKAALSEITEKIDENDRRCVLLKADMAGFSDDIKLSRNKENAQDLHKKILAKEKTCRIAAFDLTHKTGLLTEEELNDMKRDYNALSLAETALAEARTERTAAEENLAFHEKLFSDCEGRNHFEDAKKSILKYSALRMTVRILGALLMGIGASLFFVLRFFDYALPLCIGVSAAVLLFGASIEFVSMVFTSSIHKVLEENGKDSTEALFDFLDRLRAHEKTTQIYREQVLSAEKKEKRKEVAKENILDRIRKKISDLGHKDAEDPVLVCDQVIEANDALYDLQNEIREDKEKYNAMLKSDIERDSLEITPEFAALQKELSFLSVQNDSLFKKRAMMQSALAEAEEHLKMSVEEIEKNLARVRESLAKETREWESADLNYTLAKERKNRFESALKERLCRNVNEKISFVLNEGESFFFDDSFELCFRDRNSVLPLISAGGGMITEMGLLAFRLSLAELLGKNTLPLIFDDSFSLLSPEATARLYQTLTKTCSQFFIATSSADFLKNTTGSAKVFTL